MALEKRHLNQLGLTESGLSTLGPGTREKIVVPITSPHRAEAIEAVYAHLKRNPPKKTEPGDLPAIAAHAAKASQFLRDARAQGKW